MKSLKNVGKLAGLIALTAGAVLFADSAMAASFGEIGNNAADSGEGIAAAIKQYGLVIGLGLVVGSFVGFATHKKTNTPISYSIIAFCAGVGLASMTAFIDAGSETAFGQSESEIGKLNLN